MFKPSDRLMRDFSDYQTRFKQGKYSCDFLDGTPQDACNKSPHNQEKAWVSCCVQELSGGGSWMVTLPSYLFPVGLGSDTNACAMGWVKGQGLGKGVLLFCWCSAS